MSGNYDLYFWTKKDVVTIQSLESQNISTIATFIVAVTYKTIEVVQPI